MLDADSDSRSCSSRCSQAKAVSRKQRVYSEDWVTSSGEAKHLVCIIMDTSRQVTIISICLINLLCVAVRESKCNSHRFD